LSLRF